MSKALEKLVIQLAYGELEGKKAERALRAIESNPSLRSIYDSHCQLGQSCKNLSDIPESQLTVEHLRTAILSAEPKSAKRYEWTTGLGLSLFASACLAAAFVLAHKDTALRLQKANVPHSFQQKAQPEQLAMTSPDEFGFAAALEAQEAKTAAVESDSQTRSKAAPEREIRSHHSQVFAKAISAETPKSQASESDAQGLTSRSGAFKRTLVQRPVSATSQNNAPANAWSKQSSSSNSSLQSSPMNSADSGFTASSDSQPTLITIQPKKDKQTGLTVAKEEQNPNDVPLGG